MSVGTRKAVNSLSPHAFVTTAATTHTRPLPRQLQRSSLQNCVHALENAHCNPGRAHPNHFPCRFPLETRDSPALGCDSRPTASCTAELWGALDPRRAGALARRARNIWFFWAMPPLAARPGADVRGHSAVGPPDNASSVPAGAATLPEVGICPSGAATARQPQTMPSTWP